MQNPNHSLLALVVDDHDSFARALTRTLSLSQGVDVVRTSGSDEHILALTGRLRPDLVIVDIGHGLELLRRLHAAHPAVELLVMGLEDGPAYDRAVRHLGARAFVSKLEGAALEGHLQKIREERTARALDGIDRQQRLELAGLLAAGVAHDLASPLTAMRLTVGGIEQRLRELEATSVDRSTVATARLATAELAELTDYVCGLVAGLSGLTQPALASAEARQLTSVAQAVDQAVRYSQLRNRGVELEINLPPGLELRIARASLVRVLINLLVNALQAFGARTSRRVTINGRLVNDQVELDVIDNAGGLPEQVKARLFDPGVTSKSQAGSGLGLAAARILLRQAGGDLVLVSSGPERTCFRCVLPAAG